MAKITAHEQAVLKMRTAVKKRHENVEKMIITQLTEFEKIYQAKNADFVKRVAPLNQNKDKTSSMMKLMMQFQQQQQLSGYDSSS